MSKYSLYLKAFIKVLQARIADENDRQLIIKNVLYGVKLINLLPKAKNYDEAVNNFQLASTIQRLMGLLTPSELVNIFPIDKDFQGQKYEMKDYFYTRDYINKLDQLKPLDENITEFLWEYQNLEITNFNVSIMCLMSDIRRFEGKTSIAEEWADMHGIQTFTMHTDKRGKQFLVDKQGKVQKVSKPRPKHLKLVY